MLKFLYRILGWTIDSKVDLKNLKKGIFAVAPHHTWKDFPLGLFTRAALGINIKYLGKAELFNGPFGFFFKATGGTAVIRTANNNVVDSVAETFAKNDELLIALAPEGTRKDVPKLRTGFYFMALKAKVPIIMVGFDFSIKKITIAEPFTPSGDFKLDMKTHFLPFFRTIGGKQKQWIENYENDIFE